MAFRPLPRAAAWRHHTARTGFEVAFFEESSDGIRIVGRTAAVEDRTPWSVEYEIHLDDSWRTMRAAVANRTTSGGGTITLTADGDGWLVDGAPAPHLRGCVDIDLEASAVTNALPVHRLALSVHDQAAVPAVFVGAADLSVSRLEQTYERLPDVDGRQ
jgi:hypothetical protein